MYIPSCFDVNFKHFVLVLEFKHKGMSSITSDLHYLLDCVYVCVSVGSALLGLEACQHIQLCATF